MVVRKAGKARRSDIIVRTIGFDLADRRYLGATRRVNGMVMSIGLDLADRRYLGATRRLDGIVNMEASQWGISKTTKGTNI